MIKAIFLNGVYESVLEEILNSQSQHTQDVNYLQPYSTQAISLLRSEQPSREVSITVYISTTQNLDKICYKADIVGWEDKTELSEQRIMLLNDHISKHQTNEENIYLINDKGEKYKNLISIRNLKKLPNNYHTSILKKVSDGTPLKPRTQAGGWAFVYELSEIIESGVPILEEYLLAQQDKEVEESEESSSEARINRLSSAPKKPEKIQVLAQNFRRNSDVIAEVRYRANGICEKCNNPAPFIKASDGKPYLEIHHKQPLSQEGDDTVDNAMAVCPNCHRELHYGIGKTK